MELPSSDPEIESDISASHLGARARRALAWMGVSVAVIAAISIAYMRPPAPESGSGSATKALSAVSNYQVSTVDFLSPSTGWVVASFDSGDFTVLHTLDGGRSWHSQLSGPTRGHAVFLKFFDESVGVFALVGARPLLYRTADGGRSWTTRAALRASSVVLSWSFVDSWHGWMLVSEATATPSPARLYRTQDAGLSWTDLGVPVQGPDVAYQVQFSYLATGWLTSASSGPYAYRSSDSGATWQRIPLAAPAVGWPRSGQFFVTVQPTIGSGLVATVVNFAPVKGRTGIGGIIRAYPPLVVRAYDGGRPHTYTYSTFNDLVTGGPFAQEQAPNQVQLASVDGGATWSAIHVPSATGAIGYFNTRDWWWVGSGTMSRSFDGGVTWSGVEGTGVVEPLPGSLQVLDQNHAWFAASEPLPVLETTADGGARWRMILLPPMEDRPTP
ncbi:MAG TPA: hypothetical protein VN906_03580 [Candidatus Sulfotelmatobacter sp.]|nr:hypothetical protein [Candidatus Sulfotelmatobacter sp.]